jgi:4-oxalocrotonate tautomerase
MPIIQVHLLEGRSVEIKRKYAAEITKTTSECLGVAPEAVRIIFSEMAHENFAVAGTLSADKKK